MTREQALYQLRMLERKVEEWKKYMREEFSYED